MYDKDAWKLAQMKVHHIAMAIFNLICVLDSEFNHPELVENYVPHDFEPEVPLSEEEADRYEARRLLWFTNEMPVEFQKANSPKELIEMLTKKIETS